MLNRGFILRGQFLFHTFNFAGLTLKPLLKNSIRNGISGEIKSNASNISVSLKAYHQGNLAFQEDEFCEITSGSYFEISDKNCSILRDTENDYTLIAHCRRGDGEQYFPQEHQVTYQSKENSRQTSLLYDQLPSLGLSPKPIVLLAPKVWVSKDINTIISFTNGDDGEKFSIETQWKIDFILQNGEIIHTMKIYLKTKNSYFLDVKSILIGLLNLTERLQMITVVARGESSACVILTFLQNTKTGALALEHSLSPHYYMNGDFSRVRREAFLFP